MTSNLFAEDSIFFAHRFLTDSAFQPGTPADTRHDLISFLAVLQNVGFNILPVTWQAARQPIGVGATSKIYETLVNLQTSFAFKSVSEDQRKKFETAKIFQALTAEITILGEPFIRRHPNIAELQGICWNVESENEVWPVLVFEKTQYGDLRNFLKLPVGNDLGIRGCLKLCVQIGTAIMDMHGKNIVHGDIKPENVLISKDANGTFTAKVTDFGYSNKFTDEEDYIYMPKSWPWNAPEHHHRPCKILTAQQMDIFSFGMLCLWVLFEKYLSGKLPLPSEAHDLMQHFQNKGGDSLGVLESLKSGGVLALLANQLVAVEEDVDENTKRALQHFFQKSLEPNQDLRTADLRNIWGYFVQQQEHSQVPDINERFNTENWEFKILHSIHGLYRSDYRVRSYLCRCLERKVLSADLPPKDMESAAFELAFCFKIGFGTARNDEMSLSMLRKSGRTPDELNDLIEEASKRILDSEANPGSIYSHLMHRGHIISTSAAVTYQTNYILEKAETEIRRELEDATHCYGSFSTIANILNDELISLLYARGKWKESEELETQVCKHRQLNLGEEDPETLVTMSNLVTTYSRQGKYKEAEQLGLQTMETSKKSLGSEHDITIASTNNLALIYSYQGKWKEAEGLLFQLLEYCKILFGDEHIRTLHVLDNLATLYTDQQGWNKADEILAQVIATSVKVLGEDHEDTITFKGHLASIYSHQGKLKEAEQLKLQTVDLTRSILGNEHPITLQSIGNLMATYYDQNRLKDAETIALELIEAFERILGTEHRSTLICMDYLAMIYREQGKAADAEELHTQLFRTSRRSWGAENPLTLHIMANLATTHFFRENWRKAEVLELKVLEIRRRVFGAEHPATLSIMDDYALTLMAQSRVTEAIRVMEECVRLRRLHLGSDHPLAIESSKTLEKWCQ